MDDKQKRLSPGGTALVAGACGFLVIVTQIWLRPVLQAFYDGLLLY